MPDENSKQAFESRLSDWERHTLARKLEQSPERKETFTTQAMKWPVNRLYTPADLDAVGFDYLRDVGFPGEYPFTRGTEANGYRSDLWTMMQVTGFGTGEDWAERGRYMLDRGLGGLFLEYDLPTTNGLALDGTPAGIPKVPTGIQPSQASSNLRRPRMSAVSSPPSPGSETSIPNRPASGIRTKLRIDSSPPGTTSSSEKRSPPDESRSCQSATWRSTFRAR